MAHQASPGYPSKLKLNWPRALAILLLAMAGCNGSTSSPMVAPPANPTPTPTPTPLADTKPIEPLPPEQLPVIKDEDYRKLMALRARVTRNPTGKYTVYVRLSPEFADESIDSILLCPNVEDLTLECVSISDQGIEKIKDLKLVRLILNGSPVTHAAIEQLSQQAMAESMISLGLKELPIADEHVAMFLKFKKLQRLDLSGTEVTDASVDTLKLLPLIMLNVANTKISAEGFLRLRELMPRTQVVTEAKPAR